MRRRKTPSWKRRWRGYLNRASNGVSGVLAIGLLKLMRLIDGDKLADFAGWAMRKLGPWLPEHRVGRANLIAAFPEKLPDEIDKILLGVWDNLGRLGAEFAHLDRLWDFDPDRPNKSGRIVLAPTTIERYLKLADDGKPALVFAAHLANWELPAICAATYNLDSAVLYRQPNIPAVNRWLKATRAASMGALIPTGFDAPTKIAAAIERGAHVGILVDQYYVQGVEVTFFGRRTRANPLLARIARHFDCPIYGTRIVRLPGHRFTAELTEEIQPARDAQGQIDIVGTMQRITDVVEGWVREHPEQWLWLHRRWRPEDDKRLARASSPTSRPG